MSPYPHHVVAMGYNTVPDGRDFTGASADLTRGATLYTTGVPCPRCALKIAQSQIVTVVYNGDHEMEREAEKTFYWGKVATVSFEHIFGERKGYLCKDKLHKCTRVPVHLLQYS